VSWEDSGSISQEAQGSSEDSAGALPTTRPSEYFQRAIPVPPIVDFTRITARFDKGVLYVTLPKRNAELGGVFGRRDSEIKARGRQAWPCLA
jgi:HSP20 family molecular chaperone IbpA